MYVNSAARNASLFSLLPSNHTAFLSTYERCENALNLWLQSNNLIQYTSKYSIQPADIASQFFVFAQDLAINFFIVEKQGAIISPPEWLRELLIEEIETNKALRETCPIVYNSEMITSSPYNFKKDFFEYFVAHQLYLDLKNKQYNNWNHQLISRKLIVYSGKIISQNEPLDFHKYIWSVCNVLKSSEQNKIIISNLLGLLNFLEFPFIAENGDFRGLILEDTDLSGANLSYANFNGALLKHVNLTNAFIPGIKCIDADMNTVKFSEIPTYYYKSSVNVICCNKNGNYIAIAVGNEIILYAILGNEIEEVRRLQGHKGTIVSIVMNAEGNLLISSSEDKHIFVWHLGEEKYEILIKGDSVFKCVALSPDGTMLVSGKVNGDVDVWDLLTLRHVHLLTGHSESINSISFTSNGNVIATADDGGKVIIWDTKKRKFISEISKSLGAVKSIAFSPDNTLLAIATNQLYLVNVDDLSNPGELLQLATPVQYSFKSEHSFFTCVAFSIDGKRIAAGSSDSRVHLWNVKSGTEIISLVRHFGAVNSVAFSPNGKWLLTASKDNSVMKWDANISCDMTHKIGFYGTIVACAFDQNNNPIALISGRKGIYLWDINHKKILKEINSTVGRVHSCAYSYSNNIAAFGCQRKSVYLLNFNKDNRVLQISGQNSSSLDLDVYCVTLNHDEKILGIADNDKVILWDWSAQKEINKMILPDQQKYTIYTLAFNINPNVLATGGSSGNLHLWDITTKKIIKKFSGHKDDIFSICFSPDGKYLASGGKDKVLRIWDVNNGTEIAKLQKHLGAIATIVFSFDGNFIATGSNDRFVYIWDVKSRSLMASLGGHWGQITTINFSQDGKYLLAGCGDYGAFLWANFGNPKEWYLMKRFTNDSYLYAEGAILSNVNINPVNRKLLEQYGVHIELSSLENTKNNLLLPPAKSHQNNELVIAPPLSGLQDQKDHRDRTDKPNKLKPT